MAGTYKAAQRKYYLSHYKPKPPRDVKCRMCGAPFVASGRGSGNKQYCSKECAVVALSVWGMEKARKKAARTIELECKQCGKRFTTATRKNVKFCSRDCMLEYFSRSKVECFCLTCGKAFYPKYGKVGKYCSIQCCGIGQRKTSAEGKNQKKRALQEKAEVRAKETQARLAEAIREKRSKIAARLFEFIRVKSVIMVAKKFQENPRTTRALLANSPAFLRHEDRNGSWRARQLARGATSRLFRIESDFCSALFKAVLSVGKLAKREVSITGESSRRIDIVATGTMGTYGIEAKHTNETKRADACLGQAVLKCHVMKYIPVCAFPSDCMPDAVFMHVARDMGVRVVNELTICKELFGHE